MPENQFTFAGTTYTLNPLRMKHLREIANNLSQPKTDLMGTMDRFKTYIEISLGDQEKAFLDDLTLPEFQELWRQVQSVSGITIGNKGEVPKAAPVGSGSTDASPSASAGVTVQ